MMLIMVLGGVSVFKRLTRDLVGDLPETYPEGGGIREFWNSGSREFGISGRFIFPQRHRETQRFAMRFVGVHRVPHAALLTVPDGNSL